MRKHYALLVILMLCVLRTRAQNYGELNINDVRARFYANGRVAYDPLFGQPHFEVPVGSGVNANYAGGLWLAGQTSTGLVRVSKTFYDIGDDMNFHPGPLEVLGGSTSPWVSQLYDRVWSVTREEIARHLLFFNCAADPNCSVNDFFPNGYIIPSDIAEWPAIGPNIGSYAPYLAPFYDFDSDGNYDASTGDVPCILGDQALFSVFGDYLSLASGNPALRIEVQQMPFAFESNDPAINQTVFVRYHMINRSFQTYTNTLVGFFNDIDLGCSNDDLIGCDPSRNLAYVYNMTDDDQGCLGAVGYGPQPPAFGMALLKGPLLDQDGEANTLSEQLPAWNGQGFGDGVADNERYGLSNFLYFNRESPNANITDPSVPEHYYNYLSGIWKDGTPLTYGGNGYSTDPNATPCAYMFPGANDPLGAGTGGQVQAPWYDSFTGIVDRRGVMSSGPITLEAGQHVDLLCAYVYARAASGGAFASVGALQARVDSVRAFAQTLPIWNVAEESAFNGQCADYATIGIAEVAAAQHLVLFPAPANAVVHFEAANELVGGTLTLRDALGRIVAQQSVVPRRNTIDISTLALGVYSVEAVTSRARFTGRLVKE